MLVDDHQMVRESLRLVLESGGCEVVGEASTGEELLALAAKIRPAVIIMDVQMPGSGGLAGPIAYPSCRPPPRC